MQKLLITGGTGFIGRRVVEQLVRKGHQVELLRSRLTNRIAVRRQLQRYKPHTVIHLAWEGLPDYGARTSAKNLIDGLTFFSLLAELAVPKVIGVGTCWEDEKINTGPRGYMLAKNALRMFGEELFKESKTQFIWVRPYFVYGIGKPPKSLFPALIQQAREGNTPTVTHDVWNDFVHVDDVAEALALLAERRAPAGIYDIGSGVLVRTGHIAQIVARTLGLVPVTLCSRHARGFRANIRPLRALGWRPRTSIEQGIRKMIQQG